GDADADVGAAAAVDEVVHYFRLAARLVRLPVVFQKVHVAGHHKFDGVLAEELVDGGEAGDFTRLAERRTVGGRPFTGQRLRIALVVAGGEQGVAKQHHGELAACASEGGAEPLPLGAIDRLEHAR